MDELFTVLSTSSDNAARKAAASQLRQLQEQQPEAFVRYTWERVACVTLPPALRFFVCSTVVSFVDESWHSAVSREVQASVLQLYVEQLALRERFTSVALARKVATVIARMAKRSTARSTALPRGLPPLVEYVVRAYVQALQVQCASLETAAAAASSNSADASSSTSAAAAALDMLPQVLLLLHVLLKELQSKRVGMSFAQLCATVAPTLSALLVRMTATLDVTPRHGEAYVYAMKCALRVYGHGILDVAFCRFALTLTWQLATHITTAAEQQQQQQQPVDDGNTAEATALLMRLLEYAMKIHVSVVASFASKFTLTDDSHTMTTTTQTTAAQEQRLPLSFFVDDADGDDGSGGRALLRLLTAIVVANSAFSLRVTCRALRLLTLLCSLEQSSAYAAEVLRRYTRASPPMLPSLLSHLITDYFADDVSAAAQRAWATSPEDVFDATDATATGGGGGASVVVVAGGGGGDDHERDVDVGDEDEHSLMDNAEQLFLALTSSPAASADALREAWAAVHTLLASGHAQDVTSALHVLGLGYRTMRSSNNNDNDGSSHAAGAASDADDADYVQFLTTRLLPVLHASASPDARVRPDVVVQRRVLWLVGMWCEATPQPQTRRVIHTAVEALLRLYTDYLAAATATSTTTSVIDGTVVVLALTALRTVQHFVADGAFTRAELTPTFVPTVMAAVQHVLPLLRAPSAVAAVAGVVHVLLAKLDALAVTDDNNNNNTQQQRGDEDDDDDTAAAMMTMAGDGVYALRGDDVVRVFHPAVVRFVQRYTQKGEDDKNSKVNKDDSNEDEDKVNVGTLTLLLECLTSAARADASDVALWSLFDTVVVPCTQPGGALAPWVQDEAWELLLAMAQSTRARHASVQDALSYALHNTQRDFAALHTVLRVTYTLMLLQLLVVLPSPSQPALVGDGVDSGGGGGNVGDVATGSATFVSAGVLLRGSAEDYCTTEQVLQWLTTLVTTTSYELVQALQALLMTVARTSTGPLCELVITQCMSHLVVCGDVQAATYALPLCIVLNVALLASAAATAMTTMTTTTAAAAVSREKSAAVCFASPLLAHDTAARTEAALSLFVEQLVLLLDVSCDALTTQCVARLLRYTQETLPVSASDAAMMQSAAMAAMQLYAGGDDGSGQTTRTSTNNNVSGTTISAGADDDDGATVEQAVAEVRPFAELLVELLEDSTSLSPPLPHLTRVLHAFALLEQAL